MRWCSSTRRGSGTFDGKGGHLGGGDLDALGIAVRVDLAVAGLAPAGVLFGFGVSLAAARLFYGLPIAAVQPMKAVSTALITGHLTPGANAAAALMTCAVLNRRRFLGRGGGPGQSGSVEGVEPEFEPAIGLSAELVRRDAGDRPVFALGRPLRGRHHQVGRAVRLDEFELVARHPGRE